MVVDEETLEKAGTVYVCGLLNVPLSCGRLYKKSV